MNPGELRYKITIQQLPDPKDSYGENDPEDNWTDFATVWAAVNPLNGREFFSSEKLNSEITHRIKIRYKPGITADMRVKFGNRYFDILYVINPKEKNIELQLMCKELF